MSGWDAVSTPVEATPPPAANSWDAVSSPVALPDTAGIESMAAKNMQAAQKPTEGKPGETQENPQMKPFSAKLDEAAGMPISGAIGNEKGSVTPTPQMRAHLMDSYEKGSSSSFDDFMHSTLHSIVSIAAGGVQRATHPIDTTEKQAKETLEAGSHMVKGGAGLIAYPLVSDANKEELRKGYELTDYKNPDAPTAVEKTNRALELWQGTVGRAMGGLYAPVAAPLSPALTPIIQESASVAKKLGVENEWAQLVPKFLGVGMDVLGGAGIFHGAGKLVEARNAGAEFTPGSGPWAQPPAEFKQLVGEKLNKPAAEVTPDDISRAIRLGFEDKAPKASDFHDTANVMLGGAAEKSGAATLREVYKKTGVSPDKVFDDAKVDPTILQDIKADRVPEAYKDLIEKEPDKEAPKESVTPEILAAARELADIHEADVKHIEDTVAANSNTRVLTKDNAHEYKASEQDNLSEVKMQVVSKDAPIFNREEEAIKRHGDKVANDNLRAIVQNEINNLINSVPEIKDALTKSVKGLTLGDRGTGEGTGAQPAEDVGAAKPSAERKSRGATRRKSRAAAAAGEPTPSVNEPIDAGSSDAAGSAEKHSPAVITPEHAELEGNLGIPETMTASQLGKIDKKISGIFANKGGDVPKASDLTDEQFQALEDYARRVEAAQEKLKSTPSEKQIKSFIDDESGALTIPDSAKEFASEIKKDILNFATPMETGSPRARAAAKDFANQMRFAQWNGARITNMLKERFTPEELGTMWEAMDEASVHAQKLETSGMSRDLAMAETEKQGIGHFKLPEEQREIITAMSDWAKNAWDRAKELEMVEGEGLPFWTPRMAALIGEDGVWGKADEAVLVRDIRTMPLALTRLEQAIGGRSLVREIKRLGTATGAETVRMSYEGGNLVTSTGSLKQRKYLTAEETEAAMKKKFESDEAVAKGESDGFFTLDHPAFQTYRPRLKMNEEGKWEIQKDADGNNLFDKTPIYISKEFEGPLKAVLSQDSSVSYKALMGLKGKSMGLIMYSPIIHNAVEWGRALPAMPGKVATFKIYFEGNKIKNDPVQMKEAIDAGMVPIGSRFFNQDINSIIEQPNLTPGRSWTAKLLGGIVGEVSPKGGEAVKTAIDKAGDFWHNTLLWDRVGDLQAGLYSNIRDHALENGMEPQAAKAVAAHVANRFAGALPMESMGNMARKMANVVMFSRSFTIGNLGVMKDMFKGMPSDVMAQLERDIGAPGAKAASKAVRNKAVAAFALDIALMYAGNSLLQDTFDHLKRDKSWGQIAKGYVDRFHELMKKSDESPWDLLNPSADMQALSSTSANEPGKENRILFSTDPEKGTNYYVRMPTGKIGEEFEGWLTSPLEMARKKLSPQISPLVDIYKNEDYFGHPIYDKTARGVSGMAENLGRAVEHLMKAQVPADAIATAYKELTGESKDKSADTMKIAGPLVGLTFSKGYPGGAEAGILAAASRRHEAEVSEALPKIKEAVEGDKEDKAREIMDSLGMPPREQAMLIRHYHNPQDKVNARSLRKFDQTATPEEKELMEKQGENH